MVELGDAGARALLPQAHGDLIKVMHNKMSTRGAQSARRPQNE